jgi:hypothetical protein
MQDGMKPPAATFQSNVVGMKPDQIQLVEQLQIGELAQSARESDPLAPSLLSWLATAEIGQRWR